jgi:hypothetical protein
VCYGKFLHAWCFARPFCDRTSIRLFMLSLLRYLSDGERRRTIQAARKKISGLSISWGTQLMSVKTTYQRLIQPPPPPILRLTQLPPPPPLIQPPPRTGPLRLIQHRGRLGKSQAKSFMHATVRLSHSLTSQRT